LLGQGGNTIIIFNIYLFAVEYSARRMRWAGHVAHIGRGEVHTGLWSGYLRERNNVEDPGIIGRIY
jgi:hypothetical protein